MYESLLCLVFYREQLREVEGEFVFAQSLDSNDTSRLAEFLDESIKSKLSYKRFFVIAGKWWNSSAGCFNQLCQSSRK